MMTDAREAGPEKVTVEEAEAVWRSWDEKLGTENGMKAMAAAIDKIIETQLTAAALRSSEGGMGIAERCEKLYYALNLGLYMPDFKGACMSVMARSMEQAVAEAVVAERERIAAKFNKDWGERCTRNQEAFQKDEERHAAELAQTRSLLEAAKEETLREVARERANWQEDLSKQRKHWEYVLHRTEVHWANDLKQAAAEAYEEAAQIADKEAAFCRDKRVTPSDLERNYYGGGMHSSIEIADRVRRASERAAKPQEAAMQSCPDCHGTGEYTWPSEDGGSPVMQCPTCKGSGKATVSKPQEEKDAGPVCEACRDTGVVDGEDCLACTEAKPQDQLTQAPDCPATTFARSVTDAEQKRYDDTWSHLDPSYQFVAVACWRTKCA